MAPIILLVVVPFRLALQVEPKTLTARLAPAAEPPADVIRVRSRSLPRLEVADIAPAKAEQAILAPALTAPWVHETP